MKIDCQGKEIPDDQTPHCFHATGIGTSHGWGGADEMQCCNCGEIIRHRWAIVNEAVPGHGRFFTRRVKVYDS